MRMRRMERALALGVLMAAGGASSEQAIEASGKLTMERRLRVWRGAAA